MNSRPDSRLSPSLSELQLERINCPLCGCAKTDVVLNAVDNLCGVPGQFAVERCLQCRHMFMNPRPTLDCMSDCYPPHYGPHQSPPMKPEPGKSPGSMASEKSSSKSVPWYLRFLPLRYVPGLRRCYYWLTDDKSQPLPELKRTESTGTVGESVQDFSNRNQQPRALELGCATGKYLQRLIQSGWAAVGVEPGIEPAAQAQIAGLDVRCGTLMTCDFPAKSFDAAAAWMVIEHVPDPRETLTQLARLLKPHGQLLISIPNAGCWEPVVFGRFWYVWELPRHLHHFTPESMRRLLSECGLTEITISHQRTLLNVVGSLGMAILSRWPQCRLGRWLKYYPDHPTLAMQLLLAPFAHLMAFLRQGGRLTITARRAAD